MVNELVIWLMNSCFLVFFNRNFINFVVFPDSCPNKNQSYIKKIMRNQQTGMCLNQRNVWHIMQARGKRDVEKATAIMQGIFKVNTR
jgi:hypothetical protein